MKHYNTIYMIIAGMLAVVSLSAQQPLRLSEQQPLSLSAQQPLSLSVQEPLTIEECRSMALTNNKQIAVAEQQVEKAGYGVKSYRANFLPWSFVAHDQLWNLIPVDNNINYSKSDRLPSLDRYLKKMAEEHRKAIKIYLGTGKKENALEDFTSLGYTPRELIQLNKEHFLAAYQQIFVPLYQIAKNMGYEEWQG